MAQLRHVYDGELHHLRRAQRLSLSGSWQWQAGATVMQASTVMLELYGLTSADDCVDMQTVDVSTLVDPIHADDQAELRASFQRLIATGEPMQIRFRVTRRSDDEVRWIYGRAIAERNDAGSIVELAGTVTDITEFVLAELHDRTVAAELRQAESYQQAVITRGARRHPHLRRRGQAI